jgi:hypothetical protein
MNSRKYLYLGIALLLLQFFATLALSQNPAPQAAGVSLRGQITDPSGAAIANADVVLTPAATSAAPIKTKSNGQGEYQFNGLAPGQYTLNIIAPEFSVYENDNVVIANQPMRLNVSLAIQVEQQKVQVEDTAPTVDVNPANNAGAITITGKELEALPDDPDELLTDLQALAGPSAGPNGGQLYIDGFTAGELPPKDSIFRGVRQAWVRPYRGLHQAGHQQVSRPVPGRWKRFSLQLAEPVWWRGPAGLRLYNVYRQS